MDSGGEGGTRDRLALLLDLTAGLAAHMELDAIADFVLDAGVAAIGARAATVCLLSESGDAVDVVRHTGYADTTIDTWRRFPLADSLTASDVIRSGEPIFMETRAERAERYPVFESAGAGADSAFAVMPLIARQRPIGALVFGFADERSFDADDRSFMSSLAGQCAIAIDRAALYDDALQRQKRLALLADASTMLADAHLDMDAALARVADLAVPTVADICAIHVVVPNRPPRMVAASNADASRRSLANRVGVEFPADLSAESGLGKALRTGEVVTWQDGSQMTNTIARSDEHRSLLDALDLGAGVAVPLKARGRVLGGFILLNHRRRPMTADDLTLATTLAERIAVLMDNARLLSQRTEISRGLQAALLPPTLPAIDGFDVAARYIPAGEGLDVGGDFYDALAMGDNRWLFVLGDVTGHGVRAAATTGLVRHTIRSAASLGFPLPDILDHVNRALIARDDEADAGVFCTVTLVLLDATAGAAWIASAGHPAPLLRHSDGTVDAVDVSGRLLGFFPDVEPIVAEITLEPGDALVAVTDGVIERRGPDGWFGDSDFAEVVRSTTGDSATLADEICNGVQQAAPGPLTDDVAIVVIHRHPAAT